MTTMPWLWNSPKARVPLSPDDTVVLAMPPWVAHDLVPKLSAPNEFRSIVNAHFKLAPPAAAGRCWA